MKITVLSAFFSLFTCFGFSQIQFEPGYIIDEKGIKQEVLIQNMEWNKNPTQVTFKKGQNSEVLTMSVNEIKEFKVANNVYERATLLVDQSSDVTSRLSKNRNPELLEETILLRKIVGGNASLYEDNSRGYKYFYKINGSPIQQLIYKRFNTNGKIAYNTHYRQQLWTDLVCDKFKIESLKGLDYSRNDLVNYFVNYNECVEAEVEVFERENKKNQINLNAKAGVDFATVSVKRGLNAGGNELTGIGFRAGIEAEYVLNFNKNKWAVYAQPMFQSVSTEKAVADFNYSADLTVNYSFLELEIGGKHYMFINDKSKLFLSAGFILGTPLGGKVEFKNTGRAMDPELTEFESPGGAVLGIGYNYLSRYIVEFKFALPRDIEGTNFVESNYNLEWRSKFSYASVTIGYKIF